jgi:hypothetical protein
MYMPEQEDKPQPQEQRESSSNRDLLILRQVALKGAVELWKNSKDWEISNVTDTAEALYKWLQE